MSKVKDMIIEVFENNMGEDGILTLPLELIAEELTTELDDLITYTKLNDICDLF